MSATIRPEEQRDITAAAEVAEARLVADVLKMARNPKANLENVRNAIEGLNPTDQLRVSDRVAEALRQQGSRKNNYDDLERVLPYLPGQGPVERKAIEQASPDINAPLSPDAKIVQEAIDRILKDRKPGTEDDRADLRAHTAQALAQHESLSGPVQLTQEIRIAAGKPPMHDLAQFESMVRQIQSQGPGSDVPKRERDLSLDIPTPHNRPGMGYQPPQDTQEPQTAAPLTITRRGDNGAPPTQPDPSKQDPINVARDYLIDERNGEKLYYRNDDGKLAIRASDQSIKGELRDARTISTMLDLAAHRGWNDVQITGDRDIARQTWIEATARGMKAEGYQPTRDDLHASQQRRIERSQQGLDIPVPSMSAERSSMPTQKATQPGSVSPDMPTQSVGRAMRSAIPTKGWTTETDGFDGLSPRAQQAAAASYKTWAETNPELGRRHNLRDYVGYVQERQSEEREKITLPTVPQRRVAPPEMRL